jgi:hypothetical protein
MTIDQIGRPLERAAVSVAEDLLCALGMPVLAGRRCGLSRGCCARAGNAQGRVFQDSWNQLFLGDGLRGRFNIDSC